MIITKGPLQRVGEAWGFPGSKSKLARPLLCRRILGRLFKIPKGTERIWAQISDHPLPGAVPFVFSSPSYCSLRYRNPVSGRWCTLYPAAEQVVGQLGETMVERTFFVKIEYEE